MTIGIYAIFWMEQDLFYIGQSSNIETRLKTHLRNLSDNKHSNYRVQEAYNSFGEPESHILEICSIEDLNLYEEIWQEEFQSLLSLDLVKAGKNHAQGLTNPRSKYTRIQLLKTFRLCRVPSLTSKEVSIFTKVSLSMVDDIRSGRAHKWLQEEYPFSWSIIESTRKDRITNGYKHSAKKLGRTYTFVDSLGVEYIVDNFTKFAKEHKLDSSDLSRVASGKYSHTKGFKLKK